MAWSGKILHDPQTGIQIKVLQTARESLGQRFEVEITYPVGTGKEGQRPHFHTAFDECFEVIAGTAGYEVSGVRKVAAAGSRFSINRNQPHLNPYNAGGGLLRLRQWVELPQPDRAMLEAFEDFIETGFGLAAEGQRPNFWQTVVLLQALQPSSYAAGTPVPVQRVVFGALAALGRTLGYQIRYARFASPEPAPKQNLAHEYHFFDRWLIPAPIEQVWEGITQTEHYTRWWGKVYDEAEKLGGGDADGVGAETRVLVHGPLPYRLGFVVEGVRMRKPHVLEVRSRGDLIGTGVWRLRGVAGGTEVGYDWRPRAESPLLRLLSPLLRPLFRYNHDWCIPPVGGEFPREVVQLHSQHYRNPEAKFASQPHVSGRAGGRTLNLHRFAREGVALLGRVRGVREGKLCLEADLKSQLDKADRFEAQVLGMVDAYIEKSGTPAPAEVVPQLRDGRLEGGRIVSRLGQMDRLEVMQQLGMKLVKGESL